MAKALLVIPSFAFSLFFPRGGRNPRRCPLAVLTHIFDKVCSGKLKRKRGVIRLATSPND